MLKVTWRVPCSGLSQLVPAANHRRVVVFSDSGRIIRSNQLGVLLSLKNRTSNTNMNKIVCNNSVQPGGGGPFNSWQGWLLGVVVSLIIPFWRNKWGPFLALKNKVDMVIDTVENVAEVVEEVAEKVEEIADEIGDRLPEGNKLKTAFDLVEKVARETANDAHIVDQFIDKVEEVEDKVESLLGTVLANQAQSNDTKIVDEPKNAQDNTTTTTTT